MTLAAPIEQPADPAATNPASGARSASPAARMRCTTATPTHLCRAAALAGGIRSLLCRGRPAAHGLHRHDGEPADPRHPAGGRIGGGAVLAAARRSPASATASPRLSADFTWLLAALLLGGLGASTQHPIASALVARAFAGTRSMTALGTYNFSGDIGKMAVPAAATVLAAGDAVASGRDAPRGCLASRPPWRSSSSRRASRPSTTPHRLHCAMTPGSRPPNGWLNRDFWLLLTLGAIDSATRAGFMVFCHSC